jgi:HEAT repeat protein
VLAHLRVDPPPDGVLYRVVTQYLLFPNTDQPGQTDKLDWIAPIFGTEGLLSAEVNVQLACLKALQGVLETSSGPEASAQLNATGIVLSKDTQVETCLWLARSFENETVSALAATVWEARGRTLSRDYCKTLLPLLSLSASLSTDRAVDTATGQHVCLAAARALSCGMKALPDSCESTIAALKSLYHSCKPVPAASTGRGMMASSAGAMTVGKGKDRDGKGLGAVVTPSVPVVMIDSHPHTRIAIAEFIRSAGAESSFAAADGSSPDALDLLDFVLAYGTVDHSSEVRAAMLTAGRAIADSYGATMCQPILSQLEAVLLKKPASKSEEDLIAYDHRHSAAVVLMGAAGRHLSAEDPSVVGITESMVTALQTPSEGVQKAVADCLVQLVQVMKSSAANSEKAKEMLERLMLSVLEEESYGSRRGAAFGIGAFVKGLGIPSLKAHDVVPRLREACTNGTVNARQGALFAIECLSERLGLLFEPYVITIVPILLKSFSHASDHVRSAAQGAAKVIMGRLSAHGVKQVLTPILTSLPEETQWKSRQEAIKLLGYMAHCAPKQLAACLPQIVPRLVEAGSDPHPKVKEGARAAMLDISSVIRNPEISRLAPVLLAAMADPANKTKEALEALLECEFMHSIDAPSLALLVPILGRALRDRGADLKRKASAITGNMVSMVSEPKTLVPYLVQVLPGLKDCLLDPIPDVRATSAKALGSLVGGVGEQELPELVPWLMETLRSEASPVERSGAAQGLAEVCLALGDDRLDEILDTALALRNQPRSAAREGLLWLLSFLPSVLAEGFASHIKTTLPVILSGLSDESEGVREVALRSGQVMVTVLGSNNALLLLPSLSEGMFDDDWRIRHSSLILLGDLLYLIGDTKAVGMADGEEEDEDLAGVSSGGKVTATLRGSIGEQNANEVLAALYIARADVSMAVRQSALQVWKSVVSNTPRTLVEIIPVLIEQLISKLSAESAELRVVAGKSLGELVRKMGDRVLPVVVPHLRRQLKESRNSEGDDALRQGVCLGLTEILAAATKRQVEDYIDSLMPALQEALCDKSEEVRSQAARAFQTLFKNVGPRAVDDIVPALLARMGVMMDSDSDDEDDEDFEDEEGEGDDEEDGDGDDDDEDEEEEESDPESVALALLGLQGVVQLRPRDLLEYLLDPSCLLRHPMQVPAAKTLAGVVQVCGAQLNYHFGQLVPALCMELYSSAEMVDRLEASVASFLSGEGTVTEDETESLAEEKIRLSAIKECAGSVMGAVTTSGVNFLSSELGRQIEHDTDVRRRRWGCWLLEQFVRSSKAVYNDYLPVLFKYLLSRVAEFDRPLLQAVSDALSALSTCVPTEDLSVHLDFIRSCVNSTASDARHRVGAGELYNSETGAFVLPLLTVPKSLEPFLTIALHGLMNGSLQARETAADVIAELAAMSDPLVLKPFLIKTTGPLIRVVGDRFPSSVKAAILQVRRCMFA